MPLFTSVLNFRRSAEADEQPLQAPNWIGLRRFAATERYNYPVTLAITDTGKNFLVSMQVAAGLQAERLLTDLLCALKSLIAVSETQTFEDIYLPLPSPQLQRPALAPTEACIGELRPKKMQDTAPQDKLLTDLLMAVWRDVLGVDELHPDGNFFELGGDSLTALRAVSLLRKWPVAISVADIFNHPTISDLSLRITHSLGEQRLQR